MRYDEISYQTKKQIACALKDALRKKMFSKVTVSELIEKCGINRKTFYYHFEDIFALLKWTLDDDAIALLSGYEKMNDYRDVFCFLLEYIEKNGYIRNCIHDIVSRGATSGALGKDGVKLIVSCITSAEKESGLYLEPDYKDFLAVYYSEAIAAIITDYIDDPERYDKSRTAGFLSDTFEISVREVIREKGSPENRSK